MLAALSTPLLLAALAVAIGLGLGAAWALRARRRPAPAEDDLEKIKAWISRLRATEADLITAGQALGKARRYLASPERADPQISDLRGILVDSWLARLDLEGRLRVAGIRRRVPPPPPPAALRGPITAERAAELVSRLSEWMDLHQALAQRAEEQARTLLRSEPSADPHARYVGAAVEQAAARRRGQVDHLQRLAARVQADGARCGEASLALAGLLGQLPEAPGGELPAPPALAALSSLGLDERKDRDHLEDAGQLASLIQRGEAAAEAALALARDAVQLDEPPPPTPAPKPRT
ncbi:MAG: hypothetical protein RL071_222 [Pseudomonadota bacterium]|jgi:hypothetical protein